MTLKIQSTAFSEGGSIPRPYTCDGKDVSPALAWSGAPEKTKSFALICDDPDAQSKTWVHWVLFNIPAQTRELPEAASGGGVGGKNDFGKIGYGGPCPPSGTHRYLFKLYALDAELTLSAGATKDDVERAMKGRILAQATLTGKYARS